MRFSTFLPWIQISLFAWLAHAQTPGSIGQPASGTHVAPGSSIPFQYTNRSSATTTSYGISVMLITGTPKNFFPAADWANGTMIGNFGNGRELFELYAMTPLFTRIELSRTIPSSVSD
jgi:hypothetical protein